MTGHPDPLTINSGEIPHLPPGGNGTPRLPVREHRPPSHDFTRLLGILATTILTCGLFAFAVLALTWASLWMLREIQTLW